MELHPSTLTVHAAPAGRAAASFALVCAVSGTAIALLGWQAGWDFGATDSVFSISSGYAPYLQALSLEARFRGCVSGPAQCAYTSRLPFVPFFHASLAALIGTKLVAHIVVKNALFWSFFAWSSWTLLLQAGATRRAATIGVTLLCFNPIWARTVVSLGTEEGYYPAILLPLALLLMTRTRATKLTSFAFGLGIAAVSMTKSALEPACLVLALLAAWRWRNAAPLAAPLLAFAGWSLWSYSSTGHATGLLGISSMDGINFFKGNNEHVLTFYPLIHLDVLDTLHFTDVPATVAPREWVASQYQIARAIAWLRQDLAASAMFFAYKMYVVFFDWVWPGKIYISDTSFSWAQATNIVKAGYPWTLESVAQALLLVTYKLGFLVCLWTGIRNLGGARHFSALVYLSVTAAMLAPLVVGFAHIYHLSVIYNVALLWALVLLTVPQPIVGNHEFMQRRSRRQRFASPVIGDTPH